jgi:uncharacterized protein YkwD
VVLLALMSPSMTLTSSAQGISPRDLAGVEQIAWYETMLCHLANIERMQRGLLPLTISPELSAIARSHSREMMRKRYFAHESPVSRRREPMDRYSRKYMRLPYLTAENLYKYQGPPDQDLKQADFRRAHLAWMKSSGHRANILLNGPFGGPTQIGVGIVVKDGSFWVTELFIRP